MRELLVINDSAQRRNNSRIHSRGFAVKKRKNFMLSHRFAGKKEKFIMPWRRFTGKKNITKLKSIADWY